MVLGQRGSSRSSTTPRTGDTLAGSAPPAGPPPYNWRATLWLVVGMLIFIGVMGVFMHAIPTPFTQPAPTAIPTPRPTPRPAVTEPRPTPAPTPGPYSLATLMASQPTAVPTRVGQAQKPPTPGPYSLATLFATQPVAVQTALARSQPTTVAPAVQPAPAVQSTAAASVPSAPTVRPTGGPILAPTQEATPIVAPTLAAEILAAYQRYWEVSDDALATLDGSHLAEVMDGPELVATQAYLNQLQSQNKAAVGPADHAITIVSATSDDAVIHDKVVDHSLFIDPTTREVLPPDQQGARTEIDGTYYLRKVDGVWKVVGEG
jgi:hypothetical protein